MSIYTECGEAARALLDDPSLRIVTDEVAPPGIFTELDVILLAAIRRELYGGNEREHPLAKGEPYTSDDMREAQREASQYMGTLFRSRQACRYGPVAAPGLDEPDYLRDRSGKWVYAAPDGPAMIETCNGTFGQMFVDDQAVPQRQGRRLGANRDDFAPWTTRDGAASLTSTTADQREILRFKAANVALQTRLDEAETEIHRLREHIAQAITRDEMDEAIRIEIARQQAVILAEDGRQVGSV